VLVLVALLPLRAVAGVTVGFCASGHQDMAVTGHAAHGGAHQDHDSPPQPVESTCNICAEHCSSAAFAASVDPALAVTAAVQDRTAFSTRRAPAFISDPQDRPPLA